MVSKHIVKSFDNQLKRLDQLIAEMGGLAESQFGKAMDALLKRDAETAALVVSQDYRLDQLEQEIDHHTISMLALRQPMASDLREIIAALKTASILERVGDYAKNVARRTATLAEMPPVAAAVTIGRLGRLAQDMVKDVLDAYLTRDIDKANMVRERDKELDALYTSLFRELLTYMMEDPRNITPCTHLLFVAKNIERVGDHATNIAELTHFLVKGSMPLTQRPQDDGSYFTVVEPHP